ncbi:MAG: peptidoglycan-binding protein, partial [Steroidobacteraceae bacterium]
QRITGRYHLQPLSRVETAAYVKHRLRVAGATSDLFSARALRTLHRVSGGVPRLINVIADRSLLGGYTEDRHEVTPAMVRKAATEVFDRRTMPSWIPWATGAATLVLIAGGAFAIWSTRSTPVAVAPEPVVAAPTAAEPEPVPAAAPVPPPAARTLTDVLSDTRVRTDVDSAYARLFALWNGSYSAGGEDPCTQALRQGLECLVLRGDASQLRLFDRPALLELRTGGASHRVVLVGLTADSAELQLGTLQERVPLAEMLAAWTGDFILLWRPPELDTRSLGVGASGSAVQSLRDRLQRALGRSADGRKVTSFDAALEHDVRAFQALRGLAVDGVAGVQTQVALDAALRESGTPLLQSTPAGAG